MKTPILSASQLGELIGSDALRIVDVRTSMKAPGAGLALYHQGHIPGAVHLDLETDLSARVGPGRHPLPRSTDVANALAAAGIGDDAQVVCYDNVGGAIAARLWWMLDDLGHDQVAVLDGGIQAWVASGLALETETPTYARALWTRREARNATFSRDQLIEALDEFLILDARAAERYRGDIEPIDKIAGHIPTARSAPFEDNLRDGVFKSSEELRERFSALGVNSARAVVSACGSGVTACHNILAMRIAGLGRTALYPGSWSDWSSSGFPVETGDGDPGE